MDERENFRFQSGRHDTARHAQLHCPVCSYGFNAAGSPDGSPIERLPDNNDLTVCFNCGELLVYVVGALGVAVRVATADELALFQSNPKNLRWLKMLHRFKIGEI